jgi:hypothetical protein
MLLLLLLLRALSQLLQTTKAIFIGRMLDFVPIARAILVH